MPGHGSLVRYIKLRVVHAPGREHFSRHRGLAILTCITALAWRTCRDAFRDRWLVVSFDVSGRENVPGIPGTCATRNFTYLVRVPCEQMVTELLETVLLKLAHPKSCTNRSTTRNITCIYRFFKVGSPDFSAIRSAVCMQMRWSCSVNHRPGNGGISVECDQRLVRPGVYHN